MLETAGPPAPYGAVKQNPAHFAGFSFSRRRKEQSSTMLFNHFPHPAACWLKGRRENQALWKVF
jgi:hypothetical protein